MNKHVIELMNRGTIIWRKANREALRATLTVCHPLKMTIARAIHPVPSSTLGLSPPWHDVKGECSTNKAHHNVDTNGLYEAVLFPKAYHRFCRMLSSSRPCIMEGRVEKDFGSITFTVNWLGFLDRCRQGS